MGDTNMDKFDHLDVLAVLEWTVEDEQKVQSGNATDDQDCAIDDAQKAQFQAKYGDEMY